MIYVWIFLGAVAATVIGVILCVVWAVTKGRALPFPDPKGDPMGHHDWGKDDE